MQLVIHSNNEFPLHVACIFLDLVTGLRCYWPKCVTGLEVSLALGVTGLVVLLASVPSETPKLVTTLQEYGQSGGVDGQ